MTENQNDLQRELLESGCSAKTIRAVAELQAALERVRNLNGFFVPLSPPTQKAVWQSDIEAAIKGEK